jgi:glutathione synthase/RimK-type ligase-like ATP-grasp enzyme
LKIAIHNRPGSFSDRWITYCEENKVDYKLVNCYDSDIISQLDDCQGLMWHWSHEDYKAALSARQLTLSLEQKGIKIFPDVNTSWHFDDKVGQKYLLEAIEAPFVKSYIFYSKKDALKWINETTFPKVFKLRGGAGSINVSLIKTKQKARQLVRKSFQNGFSSSNSISRFKDRFWVLKRDRNLKAVKGVMNGFGRLFIPREVDRISFTQKGYVYFQDFIPKNDFDTRLVVIGNRCFGLRRYCRKDDFRASGSGVIKYEPSLFSKELIEIAFKTANKLNVQSIALDFIVDKEEPKIVEISYAFSMGKAYDDCPGFWDSNLNWHNEPVNPQYFIIEDFIEDLKNKTK